MTAERVAFYAAGFLLAPLLAGVIAKTKAWFAGRTGVPVEQGYYDVWKLLRKGAVYSEVTTWVFKLGPPLGLASMGVVLSMLPFGTSGALLAFSGDVFVIAGLLAVARFATVVSALDTGSSFEGMGASREVTFAALAEPALFLGLSALALVTRDLSLTDMFNSIGWMSWTGPTAPTLAMVAVAFFLLLLVENARIPVDDPNTHLELTMIHEVMVLDHSGPDFAYITYAGMLKMWLFASLVVGVVYPFHSGNMWVDGGLYLGGVMLVGAAVGVVESVMARLRMMQVPHLLVGSGVLGVLGVALATVLR